MIDLTLLERQLGFVIGKTDLKVGEKFSGKVRDSYILPDRRIIITTDRLSAFDVILCTLPFKGQVLNELSAFWFEKTKGIVRDHVISIPDPNVTVAKNCSPYPVEFVVRGYITGVTTTSIWYNYSRGSRVFCGHKLPDGLKKDQQLEAPLLTPSTKADKGGHDESVSREEILRRGLMDSGEFDEIAEISLKLFEAGQKIAAKNGIILVDTKYEFGKDDDGNITLIDEVHTPDSSRFWFQDSYDELFSKGEEQKRIDKEYVRKWLADRNYLGQGTVPEIPDEIRVEAARRYIDAYEQITGNGFNAVPGNASDRILKNLEKGGYLG